MNAAIAVRRARDATRSLTWHANEKRQSTVRMHMHTRSLQCCLMKSRRACKTEATSHISLQREQEGCARTRKAHTTGGGVLRVT